MHLQICPDYEVARSDAAEELVGAVKALSSWINQELNNAVAQQGSQSVNFDRIAVAGARTGAHVAFLTVRTALLQRQPNEGYLTGHFRI